MSHESKVIFLRRMTEAVRAEHLKILGSGPPAPNTNARDTLMQKVADWESRLAIFEKTVKSELHFARVQTGGNRYGASFSQRQSYRSRQANAAGLRALSGALTREIAGLIAALDPESVAWKHLIKSLEKILEEGGGDDVGLSQIQHHELTHIVQQATDAPAPGGSPSVPGMSLLTFALALFTILRGMKR